MVRDDTHLTLARPGRRVVDRRYPVLGPPFTLFLGTLGYALYVGALWW